MPLAGYLKSSLYLLKIMVGSAKQEHTFVATESQKLIGSGWTYCYLPGVSRQENAECPRFLLAEWGLSSGVIRSDQIHIKLRNLEVARTRYSESRNLKLSLKQVSYFEFCLTSIMFKKYTSEGDLTTINCSQLTRGYNLLVPFEYLNISDIHMIGFKIF